jgi:peptidoglycan/LPS O-acetylase OafA/YrhL
MTDRSNLPVKPDYLPRLDGLRAVAILLVLAQHFYHQAFGFGENGVILFFVISGFLITSILLRYPAQLSVKEAARMFYVRRALRLVPVYYLCIALAVMFDLEGLRQTWWIDGLWLTNFRVALAGSWGQATHFWTLAVEEQFYLLWFLVVMMTPRRLLAPTMVALVALGPLWRWTMMMGGNYWYAHVMLPGVIDSLAGGALLAYASSFSRNTFGWRRFEQVRMPATLGLLVIVAASEWLGVHSVLLVNLLCVCLVSVAADVSHDWRIDWLGARAIRHLGRISYSLYVFHYFLRPLRPQIFAWSKSNELNSLTRFAVLTVLSVAIAELSWQLVEKPINRFRDRTFSRRAEPINTHIEAAIERCPT